MFQEQDLGKFQRIINTSGNKVYAESLSRTTIHTTSSSSSAITAQTAVSSEPSATNSTLPKPQTLAICNGRAYLSDITLRYPLPVDLIELNRQSLRTLLLIQIYGSPVCSPAIAVNPPTRVLEIGCGFGFWSMMCHKNFMARGHGSISFTGIDMAPLSLGHASSIGAGCSAPTPACDMNWRFVQHDIRKTPFPLPAADFDLIMVKDMNLATTTSMQQPLIDEYLRLLRPDGILEIWESDHPIRILLPQVPQPAANLAANLSQEDEREFNAAAALGIYPVTASTTLSAPVNGYLLEYSIWIKRALEARGISAVPCTAIGPMLLQESDSLYDVCSRRLAVPLSVMRWERNGLDNIVTTDGKIYGEWNGLSLAAADAGRKELSDGQAALRRTALLTVVQQIQSLEQLLREVSNKSQDEWDGWLGKMMSSLLKDEDILGECLEIGAWWARKKSST